MQKSRAPNPVIPNYAPKAQKKEEEAWVTPQPCYACKKVIPGAYGHTLLREHMVWSCSAKCEHIIAKEKESNSFLKGEQNGNILSGA